MTMAKTYNEDLWYANRDGITRGPFSGEYITRYILLGRIHFNDQLSRTGSNWRPVTEYPELIPEELSGLDSWENYQKLILARIKYDERISARRSGRLTRLRHEDRRKQTERRRVDGNIEFFEYQLLDRRRASRDISGTGNNRQFLRLLLIAALLAALAAVYFGTSLR